MLIFRFLEDYCGAGVEPGPFWSIMDHLGVIEFEDMDYGFGEWSMKRF